MRVNTCSVTELADKRCRQAIRRISKQHPGAFIVVTGLLRTVEAGGSLPYRRRGLGSWRRTEIRNPSISGERKKEHGGTVIASQSKDIRSFSLLARPMTVHVIFLKVQDGCDYYCSYCTIPFARGRSRNGTIASMVEQAQEVARKGGKEIVLTGVNIGDFGKSTDETFIDLIRALDEVDGIVRYRISSIEPNLITDEAIDFVAHSKRFAPHFHIPFTKR